MLQFDACGGCSEVPVSLGVVGIAIVLPGGDFVDEGLFVGDAAVEAPGRLDESAVIGHAIKTLSAGGEVKLDILHRIYKVYGRQLNVLGADGTRSTVAVLPQGAALSD